MWRRPTIDHKFDSLDPFLQIISHIMVGNYNVNNIIPTLFLVQTNCSTMTILLLTYFTQKWLHDILSEPVPTRMHIIKTKDSKRQQINPFWNIFFRFQKIILSIRNDFVLCDYFLSYWVAAVLAHKSLQPCDRQDKFENKLLNEHWTLLSVQPVIKPWLILPRKYDQIHALPYLERSTFMYLTILQFSISFLLL